MSKKKIIIIIVSVVLVVGAAIAIPLIVLYNIDQHKQLQETQYIENVYESIIEWDRLFVNTENRDYKITLYKGLEEFNYQFKNNIVPIYHC